MSKPDPAGSWLKRLAWKTPSAIQHRLRKYHFMWQAFRGRLGSNEAEHTLLPTLLEPGAWVIDVGANVGLYTLRMSELVGPRGRVIAFEPVASTFEILTATCRFAAHDNISLINAAASDRAGLVSMSVPRTDGGVPNFYQARVEGGGGEFAALAVPIDSLGLPSRIALVKIDAEGHDSAVLRGMRLLVERDRPTLIIEYDDPALGDWLASLGYRGQRLPDSSNRIYTVST